MPKGVLVGVLFALILAFGGCRTVRPPVAGQPPAAPPPPVLEAAEEKEKEDEELTVKKVSEEIILAAWAEPKGLPEGGGAAQLLVRVQKRGGAAFPGVEVRFRTSKGSLYSGGRVLVTDERGRTRDRLTTQGTATVTLNAGGTRYRFKVPVGEARPE